MAAANYAENLIESPPFILTLVWQCEQWKTLPEPGGLLNQPLQLMTEMEVVGSTYKAFRQRAQAKNLVEFSRENPKLVEYCFEIDKLRRDG